MARPATCWGTSAGASARRNWSPTLLCCLAGHGRGDVAAVGCLEGWRSGTGTSSDYCSSCSDIHPRLETPRHPGAGGDRIVGRLPGHRCFARVPDSPGRRSPWSASGAYCARFSAYSGSVVHPRARIGDRRLANDRVGNHRNGGADNRANGLPAVYSWTGLEPDPRLGQPSLIRRPGWMDGWLRALARDSCYPLSSARGND